MIPDLPKYREDFPILSRNVYGKSLIYLDNAATTQVPVQVVAAIAAHYAVDNANVHRGIHYLSEQSTQKLETARETVRNFIGAATPEEIIFTQGTTDGINLVASGLAHTLSPGDEIIVSQLEHHSNFVPWQQLCRKRGAHLRILPTQDGEPDLEAFYAMLGKRTRLVAVTQVSNLTGTVMPLKEIIAAAHACGALVLVDGAQGIRHEPADMQAMGCDFYCFSGHKMLAPTGIGVLYGKREHLEALAPVRFGGGMVDRVSENETTFAPLPSRLEAGTPNYTGAIALGEAIRYLERIGRKAVSQYEHELLRHTEENLLNIHGLTLLGHPRQRAGVVSFSIDGIHPYDLASFLDKLGIAVRSGNHCAQIALERFGMEAATRVSPAFYNTFREIDMLCEGIQKSVALLKKWKPTVQGHPL